MKQLVLDLALSFKENCMQYRNLYSKKEKNALIRNIMITRKKRAEIINDFCQKPTRFIEVDENKLMLGLMTHKKIHPFIKKVFSYFVDYNETESMLLTRSQTFRGLHIPFAYFSERESMMYALSSYLQDYDKRKNRNWRIKALMDQAYHHEKTKDMALFLNGIMLFNDAIQKDFDEVELANSFVLFNEINETSPLYGVAIIFRAIYLVMTQDFSEAFDTVAYYREVSDNEIFKLFEDKIVSFLPKSTNVIYLNDFVGKVA
jgi:hypothetical protein